MNQPKTKADILEELLNNPAVFLPADTTIESSFTDDLDMDSLDFLELAMEAEKQFHVDLEDQDLGKIKTVGDLVNEIEFQLNKEIIL